MPTSLPPPGLYSGPPGDDFVYQVTADGILAYPTRSGIGPKQGSQDGWTPYTGSRNLPLLPNYSDVIAVYKPVATNYNPNATPTVAEAVNTFQQSVGRLPYVNPAEQTPGTVSTYTTPLQNIKGPTAGAASTATGSGSAGIPAAGASASGVSAYKDSAAYKALPQDLKDLVDLGVTSFLGTPEQQQAFTDALVQAQALADPYAKSQLALFSAEFQTLIARTKFDYNAEKEILERTRENIAKELTLNRDFLTLTQQAEMARELRNYDEDLLTIADQAAEKGLTFATGARSRVLAEERRGEEYQDVIQSSQRKLNFQIKDLELRAARGDAEAAARLSTLQGQQGFDLSKIGQQAEKILGTANLPAIEGFTPVGGVLGQVEQEKRKSILDIASYALPQ